MEFKHVSFSGGVHEKSLYRHVFMEEMIQRDLLHTHEETWTPKNKITIQEFAAKVHPIASAEDTLVFYVGDCLVFFEKYHSEFHVTYGFKQYAGWKEADKFVREIIPPSEPEEEHKVEVCFWYASNTGGRKNKRHIEVPSWEDISHNYGNKVVEKLERVQNEEWNDEIGRLILWHGEPGTGKTYAIRSLIWNWRKWAKFHYITDSEKFFSDSEYMLTVLFGESGGPWEAEDEEAVVKNDDKWHLIIVEDAGELISADAKERTGQGLSKLLNTADGLLGQGLKVIILITTNEPLRKLHEAIVREGRIASEIEFKALSLEETKRWLDKNKVESDIPDNPTLARLYALKAGNLEDEEHSSMGFS